MRVASRSVASRHGASTWDVPLVRLSRSLGGLGFSDGWALALLWIEDPIRDQLHAVTHEEPCQRVSPHEAIVRLVGMVLVEQHDESAVALRHMSAGSLAKVATSADIVELEDPEAAVPSSWRAESEAFGWSWRFVRQLDGRGRSVRGLVRPVRSAAGLRWSEQVPHLACDLQVFLSLIHI